MFTIQNVTFTYNSETGATGGVHGIDLEIPTGQFVVLCGESGCGKTTVTRLLNGLIPHYYEGTLTGSVQLDGQDVTAQPLYDTAAKVSSVFQNPRSQFLMWIPAVKSRSAAKTLAGKRRIFCPVLTG